MTLAKLGKLVSLSIFCILISRFPLIAGWRISGPYGGSARSLAIDVNNGRLLLAGSRDSLVFRSDDAGATWRLLPFPEGTPGTIAALLIDPKTPEHFYAGLDAGDAADSGVYESTDGGRHWTPLGGTRGLRIESLAAFPADPRVLAAGRSRVVFVTEDGGTSWRRASRADNPEMQDITALAFDPADYHKLYGGTPHLPWKTTDGGESWHSIHNGLIDDSDIFSIRVNPQRPELVFASACSGIYRSESGGESWVKLRGIPGTHRRTHIIAEDPRNADIVFAGTTLGLFKTPDGGKTWQHLNGEQVNWMVFDPTDPNILYLATEYAGILKSTDFGVSFHAVNHGFSNHRLSQITGHGKRLYASSTYEGRYGGVFTSDDGGLDWTLRASEEALQGRNLNSLVAAPGGEVLYAASAEGVLKSTDAGKTWAPLPAQPHPAPSRPGLRAGTLRIQSLQVLQADKLVLFAGTDKGLFRGINGGATWEAVKTPGIAGTSVPAVYAPARGSAWIAARTVGGLFISEDAGRTWHAAALPDSSYFVYDLALPAERDSPILAATSRGVLQSLDGGAHWELIVEGVPASTVSAIRFHPTRKLEAYLVQYGNIYRSLDGGNSWRELPGDGLDHASIRALWFAPEIPDRIIALSAGRGALTLDLSAPDVARQSDTAVGSSKEEKEER